MDVHRYTWTCIVIDCFGSCLLRVRSSFQSGQPEFELKLRCDADPAIFFNSSLPEPGMKLTQRVWILWFYDAPLHLDLAFGVAVLHRIHQFPEFHRHRNPTFPQHKILELTPYISICTVLASLHRFLLQCFTTACAIPRCNFKLNYNYIMRSKKQKELGCPPCPRSQRGIASHPWLASILCFKSKRSSKRKHINKSSEEPTFLESLHISERLEFALSWPAWPK